MFQFKLKKYRALSDEELVSIYKDTNDKNCISIIYERYSHLVMGTSLKYLKNQHLAEDITMQVFESLFKKLHSHSINYFKSWLYIVTKNECLMYLRKHQMSIPIELDQQASDDSSLEEKEETEIKIDKLLRFVKELKPDQRDCVDLFYLQGKSYQEITTTTGLPLKKVKSHIQNGKRNLKLLMEQT